MADFIVDDEEVAYEEKDTSKHSSLKLNESKSGSAKSLPGRRKEVPFAFANFDERYKFESLDLEEVDLAGKSDPLNKIDIPERMQVLLSNLF